MSAMPAVGRLLPTAGSHDSVQVDQPDRHPHTVLITDLTSRPRRSLPRTSQGHGTDAAATGLPPVAAPPQQRGTLPRPLLGTLLLVLDGFGLHGSSSAVVLVGRSSWSSTGNRGSVPAPAAQSTSGLPGWW